LLESVRVVVSALDGDEADLEPGHDRSQKLRASKSRPSRMLKIRDVTVHDTVANQSAASGDARRPVAASRPAGTLRAQPGPRNGRPGLPSAPSWRRPGQIPNPDQVVHGQRKGEHPADAPHPAMACLTKQTDGLRPPEDLFHPLALLLTDGIARMTGGAAVNGTASIRGVLRDVGGDLPVPDHRDEACRVVTLI